MIYTVSIWLLPVLIAITFHEAAHAFVARFQTDLPAVIDDNRQPNHI
jgi:hypothetical protein